MVNEKKQKNKSVYAIIILIMLGIGGFAYFKFLNPLSDSNNSKNQLLTDKGQISDGDNTLSPEERMVNKIEKEGIFEANMQSFKNTAVKKRLSYIKDPVQKAYTFSSLLDIEKVKAMNNGIKPIKQNKNILYYASGIVKEFSGGILTGVTVENLNTGEKILSDSNGGFKFTKPVSIPQIVTLKLTKRGYGNEIYTRDFKVNTEKLSLSLIKSQLITVSIKKGVPSEIKYTGGYVKMPKDSLVDTNGNLVYGEVKFEIAYKPKELVRGNETISRTLAQAVLKNDPEDILDGNSEWKRVVLETFGMVDINIYSLRGEKLNLRKGENAELGIKVSDKEKAIKDFNISSSNPITKSGFWYLNEKLGVWENYPDGKYDFETDTYVASVPHFSSFNFDYCYQWSWSSVRYSTKSKTLKNGKNKVTSTIDLTIERN